MKNTNLHKFVLTIAAMAVTGGALATDSGSSTLGVSATVASECAVAQNVAIGFANLDMLDGAGQSASDSVAAGSVNAICTNGTPTPGFKYESLQTEGTNFRLKGAGVTANDYITYTLYQDAAATVSQVTGGTAIAHPSFTATGAAQTLDLSARVAAADKQLKLVQSYADTITVTTVFGL